MNTVNRIHLLPLHRATVFAAVALCFSSIVTAGEKIDRTIDASESPFIDVEHVNGKAIIKVWDNNQVRVAGELGDDTDKFIFERNGREIDIHIKTKPNRGFWGGSKNTDGDDITIYVPRMSSLSYESVNANVNVSGISQGLSVEVVNGDVEVANTSGKTAIESVNGMISVDGVSGDISLETVNGKIEGRHVDTGDIKLSSVNGDITIRSSATRVIGETVNGEMELSLDSVRGVALSTVNGEIKASMVLVDNGDVDVSSVGGDIELTFKDTLSARFEIEAHAGGNIVNRISDDKMEKAKYGPGRWLEFVHNGGNGRVEVSTVSGRVVIQQ